MRVLERHGFRPRPKKRGSHLTFVRTTDAGETIVVVVVQGKREIPRGTLKAILAQARISHEDFLKTLR